MTAAAFIDSLEAALKAARGAQAVCVSQLEMAKAIALLRAGEEMRSDGVANGEPGSYEWDAALALSTEWRSEVPR